MIHPPQLPTCSLKNEPCRHCSNETLVVPYTKLEQDKRTGRLVPTGRGDDTIQLGCYCNNINMWIKDVLTCPKDDDTMKGEELEKARQAWEKELMKKTVIKKKLIKKPVEKPVKKEKIVKKVVKAPIKKTVKKPAKKPVKKTAKKPAKKPVKKVTPPKKKKVAVKKPVVKKPAVKKKTGSTKKTDIKRPPVVGKPKRKYVRKSTIEVPTPKRKYIKKGTSILKGRIN